MYPSLMKYISMTRALCSWVVKCNVHYVMFFHKRMECKYIQSWILRVRNWALDLALSWCSPYLKPECRTCQMRSHNADLSPPQIYFAVFQSSQTLLGYSKKEYDIYREGRQKFCTAGLKFLIGWNTWTVSSCDARLDHIVLLKYL